MSQVRIGPVTSGSSSSGTVTSSFAVDQTAHGFSVGNVVRNAGSDNTYAKAKADSGANAEVVGIVTTVTNANRFTITTEGIVTTGVPANSAGTVMFLSDSTAGAMTSTEPTDANSVSKPLAVILGSGAKMLFKNFRGEVLTSSGGSGGSGSITVEEEDAGPSVSGVTTIKVTNGTLTDEGSGVVVIDTGAGSGSGDVVGPASATDNAIARFDLTTGKLLQNSGAILDDSNNLSGLGTIGSGAITSSGLLSFTGTGHAGVKLNSLTTTQRDALTAAHGDLIYNTTLSQFQKYENSQWVDVGKSPATKVIALSGSGIAADVYTDGTADHTDINAILASNTDIYLHPGTYNISGNLVLTSLTNVTIRGAGKGSTIINIVSNSVTDAIRISDSSYITIKDLEIDGNKSDYTENYTVTIRDTSSNIVLDNLYVHDAPKSTIQLIGSGVSLVTIKNSNITGAGVTGVVMQDTISCQVKNCYLTGNTVRDIHHFYSAGGGSGNVVEGCTAISSCSGYNMQSKIADSVFRGNIVKNGIGGIGCSRGTAVIVNNRLYGHTGEDAIAVAEPTLTSAVISGNHMTGVTGSYNGIFVGDGCGPASVTGNYITNFDRGGIRIYGSTNSSFTGNTLYLNSVNTGGVGAYNEIWLGTSSFGGGSYPSTYNTIANNTIVTTLAPYGIYLASEDYNTVTGNTISGATSAAIFGSVLSHSEVANNNGDIAKGSLTTTGRIGVLHNSNTTAVYMNTFAGAGRIISEKSDFTNTGRPLTIATKNSTGETARFDASGNFGVGNSSLSLKIESSGNIGVLNTTNLTTVYLDTTAAAISRLISEKSDFSNTARTLTINTKSSRGESLRIDTVGNTGIGVTSPTATLHLKAGTATANTAPLKLNSGTNLTSPEAGAIEYDGTSLYFTPSATRMTVGFTDMSNLTPVADFSMASHKITNVTDPASNQDAATKAYVDSVATGLNAKSSCAVATTANITLSGEQTIDGVLTSANRVLVKNQSTGSQNGIYVSGAGAWSRATDADTDAEVLTGMYAFITGGSTQASTGWVLTTPAVITVGSTSLTFAQFSAAISLVAGDGLTLTGNTIDVVGTSNRISVAANAIDISSSYIGQNTITTLGTIATGVWNGTDVAVTDGGTGASTASDARTNLGLGTIATQDSANVTITGGSITGITDIAVADGGTGSSTASGARTNLGLGSIATQASSSVSITGGTVTGITDLAVADGGTGASDATTARTNLGLGSIATQASSSVSISGGLITGITDITIADGGTGASTATAAFNALSPSTTQGDMIYHNGTDDVRLAKGTGLQQLRMNSGATAPEWAAARTIVELGSDVLSTASTSFQNITGLSFSVTSGVNYRFYAMIMYIASANTIGLRVSLTAPATTLLAYHTKTAPPSTTGGVPTPGTAIEFDNWQVATDSGTSSGASVQTTAGNLLILEGFIRPSASGTVQLRFAPETATASGIIIKAGSTLEYW